MPTDNKIIYQCSKCPKNYKSNATLQKHIAKCSVTNTNKPSPVSTSSSTVSPSSVEQDEPTVHDNVYDVSMKFMEGNKMKVEVHKQDNDDENENENEKSEYNDEDGKQLLKDMLRPKVSHTYQDEIDKLDKLIEVFKNLRVSDDPLKKDNTIEQLKTTITILMTQSQNLIKEMKTMSRKNSYYRNNIMMASFILDKCRVDPPETDDEFDRIFD